MTSPIIYFYCRDEEGNLQEDVIALAEGFDALGIRHYGNINYWLQSTKPGDYLIKHDPAVTPDDCDIVVVSYTWPTWIEPEQYRTIRRPLPEGLFKAGRRYRTVYMDSHDGYRTVSWEPAFRQFDLILRSKVNQRAFHPANVRPWVLGMNHRILDATADGKPFRERERKLLVNFGASHPYPHGTREVASARFEPKMQRVLEFDRTKDDLSRPPADPYEALMWRQTGRRFSRSYYERLKSTQAVACFCGDLIPPAPFHPDRYLVGGKRAMLRRALFEGLARVDPRPDRAIQWDSFRFWEALCAGCATINIDLPHYGVQLPVMPANWQHYIGIDFDHVDQAVDRIMDDPGILERVAAEGRQWALANYAPKVMAERLVRWALTEPAAVLQQELVAATPITRPGAVVDADISLTRVARKANQALVWLRSVRSPLDWPAATALAVFRTRPPRGTGPLVQAIRRWMPYIWIRPKLLRGLWLRIDPTRMSHFTIYEELLIENAYNLDLLKFTPDVVIDCGAFEGYFALLARARFGAMPIVAFEPNAENFSGLVANVRGNGLSIDLHASAVSITDGEATFAGRGCGGHMIDSDGGQSVRVPMENLGRIIRELDPKRLLIKIDVEGEERVILPDILPLLPRTCAMFFEWHHGAETFQSATEELEKAGFRVEERRHVVQADTGETFFDAFAQRV